MMWTAFLCALPCATAVVAASVAVARVGYGLWANVTRRGVFYE